MTTPWWLTGIIAVFCFCVGWACGERHVISHYADIMRMFLEDQTRNIENSHDS